MTDATVTSAVPADATHHAVVGFDGSANSAAALEWAFDHVTRLGGGTIKIVMSWGYAPAVGANKIRMRAYDRCAPCGGAHKETLEWSGLSRARSRCSAPLNFSALCRAWLTIHSGKISSDCEKSWPRGQVHLFLDQPEHNSSHSENRSTFFRL